jgi:hypothetical protein
MLDNLKLAYDFNADMVEITFNLEPGAVEKLHDACDRGKIRRGDYVCWDEERNIWFAGFLHMSGEEYQLSAEYENGRIRLACYPDFDRLDHTAPVVLADQWHKFVQPLRVLTEVLA